MQFYPRPRRGIVFFDISDMNSRFFPSCIVKGGDEMSLEDERLIGLFLKRDESAPELAEKAYGS